MKFRYLMYCTPVALAGAAFAQQGQQASPPPGSPPAQAAPMQNEVSGEEVSQFALAALMIQQIANDESLEGEQQQMAMASAVEQAGLEPQRYSEIARQSQSDPELQQQIQLAAQEHMEAAQQRQ